MNIHQVWADAHRGQKETSYPLGLEFSDYVPPEVGAWNWTRVLWKRSSKGLLTQEPYLQQLVRRYLNEVILIHSLDFNFKVSETRLLIFPELFKQKHCYLPVMEMSLYYSWGALISIMESIPSW